MTVEFDFVSDNVAGASPELLDALVPANAGHPNRRVTTTAAGSVS